MGGWGEYLAAWAVFLLSHMLPARPRLRPALVSLLGQRGYVTLYSCASVAVLAWLIAARGRAPYLPLWDWAAWQAWVPNVAMPFACVLLALGIGIPNPFSIGGARPERFDAARPGILGVTRHPVLVGITLWAASHIPPNGDLASVTLFGAFALMGLVGMGALDRRRRRAWGREAWLRMSRRTGLVWPGVGELGKASAMKRIAFGLAVWLLLLWLHRPLIGAVPLPALR